MEKLNNLIPNTIPPGSSNQKIVNETYKNRLGEKMLAFVYQIQNNVRKRHLGGDMCIPIVSWTPTTEQTLTCIDNLLLFGVLAKSEFYRILNVYVGNIQKEKMYRYMRSQGKIAYRGLTPSFT